MIRRLQFFLLYGAFVFSLFISCSKEKELDASKLYFKSGLACEMSQEKPFTGRVVSYFDRGLKQVEGVYRSGKRDGRFTEWYANGQVKFEGHFKDDMPDGLFIYADSSGLTLYEHIYTSGLRSEPIDLSERDVMIMIEVLDMCHPIFNPTAKGFAHLYVRNGDVISDEGTGLLWQQGGSEDELTYDGAERYIKQLNASKFAGYSDWRFPTLEEVMSLLENGAKNGDLYIDPMFDATQSWVWTSDKVRDKQYHWIVRFAHGDCANNGVVKRFFVRAVRM
ncbi:DUF1566 domain-containing protein [candidate division KSB1 bacterium]|nr:DUF1566 domain-containing protein [candidate division KSB1 bacterium]